MFCGSDLMYYLALFFAEAVPMLQLLTLLANLERRLGICTDVTYNIYLFSWEFRSCVPLFRVLWVLLRAVSCIWCGAPVSLWGAPVCAAPQCPGNPAGRGPSDREDILRCSAGSRPAASSPLAAGDGWETCSWRRRPRPRHLWPSGTSPTWGFPGWDSDWQCWGRSI